MEKQALETNKKTGKAAIASKSVQGDLIAIVGAIGSALEIAGKLPLGGTSVLLTIAGSLFSLIGRINAKEKITGIITAK